MQEVEKIYYWNTTINLKEKILRILRKKMNLTIKLLNIISAHVVLHSICAKILELIRQMYLNSGIGLVADLVFEVQ